MKKKRPHLPPEQGEKGLPEGGKRRISTLFAYLYGRKSGIENARRRIGGSKKKSRED